MYARHIFGKYFYETFFSFERRSIRRFRSWDIFFTLFIYGTFQVHNIHYLVYYIENGYFDGYVDDGLPPVLVLRAR